MKLVGCICLIAGTAIGAGMLALPIILAKFGLLYSTIIMLGTWLICYLSALLNLELNLRVGKGLPLGVLGAHFSGPKAYVLGSMSLLLLCYALLCAYIYGAASSLICIDGLGLSMTQAACAYAACLGILMMCSLNRVDVFNRILFLGKVLITGVILCAVFVKIDLQGLPIRSQMPLSLGDMDCVLPVVFTSFGFQVIFHTLTNYTNGDQIMLKRAFFWGSLLPAILYIAWTAAVCGLIYNHNADVFGRMLLGKVEVGEMLTTLCHISGSTIMQTLTWAIGFFAIITSTIGVAAGLLDAIKAKHRLFEKQSLAVLLTVLPPLLIALMIPNAFIKALSFAGIILSIIALLLPTYLLVCSNRQNLKNHYWYPILKNPLILGAIVLYGLCVIYGEMYSLLGR